MKSLTNNFQKGYFTLPFNTYLSYLQLRNLSSEITTILSPSIYLTPIFQWMHNTKIFVSYFHQQQMLCKFWIQTSTETLFQISPDKSAAGKLNDVHWKRIYISITSKVTVWKFKFVCSIITFRFNWVTGYTMPFSSLVFIMWLSNLISHPYSLNIPRPHIEGFFFIEWTNTGTECVLKAWIM